MLDLDRIAATYHALPRERRDVARRDPVWCYCLARTPRAEVERVLNELERVDPQPLTDVGRALALAAWGQ
jgi:hypothetical protein